MSHILKKRRTRIKKSILFSCLLLFLSGCTFSIEQEKNEVIDLLYSTTIIREAITHNTLKQLLEEHNPEHLNLLLNNIPPAKLAFESEVLATAVPLVVVYYFRKSFESEKELLLLKEIAARYDDDQVKFVSVDIDKLFVLAQDAEIETVPTITVVKNREMSERFEGENALKELKDYLSSL